MNYNYLGNAFSLQMAMGTDYNVSVKSVSPELVAKFWINQKMVSCIGHADTAKVVGSILGVDIPMNRISVTLKPGDRLFVAQITGGRLPEGVTTLPDGFHIEWKLVQIEPENISYRIGKYLISKRI